MPTSIAFSTISGGECSCCQNNPDLTCSVDLIGEEFDINLVDVVPCGCVGGFEVITGPPLTFHLVNTVGENWESDPTGTTVVNYAPEGVDCDTFYSNGTYKATATCTPLTHQFIISIQLDLDVGGSIICFQGTVNTDYLATNTFTCGTPGVYVGGGTVEYVP